MLEVEQYIYKHINDNYRILYWLWSRGIGFSQINGGNGYYVAFVYKKQIEGLYNWPSYYDMKPDWWFPPNCMMPNKIKNIYLDYCRGHVYLMHYRDGIKSVVRRAYTDDIFTMKLG